MDFERLKTFGGFGVTLDKEVSFEITAERLADNRVKLTVRFGDKMYSHIDLSEGIPDWIDLLCLYYPSFAPEYGRVTVSKETGE